MLICMHVHVNSNIYISRTRVHGFTCSHLNMHMHMLHMLHMHMPHMPRMRLPRMRLSRMRMHTSTCSQCNACHISLCITLQSTRCSACHAAAPPRA